MAHDALRDAVHTHTPGRLSCLSSFFSASQLVEKVLSLLAIFFYLKSTINNLLFFGVAEQAVSRWKPFTALPNSSL